MTLISALCSEPLSSCKFLLVTKCSSLTSNSCLGCGFNGLTAIVPTLSFRSLFIHELLNGVSRPFPFFLSILLSSTPFLLLQALLVAPAPYWLIGLRPTPGAYVKLFRSKKLSLLTNYTNSSHSCWSSSSRRWCLSSSSLHAHISCEIKWLPTVWVLCCSVS